jgi:hypothetical protein
MYWITSSRRSCSKSTSMSGGSRARRDEALEQQVVLRRIDLGDAEAVADAELAAEPRPWHRIPRPRAKRTMSWTVRKYGA